MYFLPPLILKQFEQIIFLHYRLVLLMFLNNAYHVFEQNLDQHEKEFHGLLYLFYYLIYKNKKRFKKI